MTALKDRCNGNPWYTVAMAAQENEIRSMVKHWVGLHPHAALFDEAASTLFDVASGKTTRLRLADVTAYEEKPHPETGDKYVVLLLEDGLQIVLVDPGGVAFAPSTENSGSVRGLPPVVCLRDFFTLKQRVDHYLHDHQDESPPRECLDMLMICIAILDGARAAGFDIADLETELEKSLDALEKARQ
jgi:hypothetical protein